MFIKSFMDVVPKWPSSEPTKGTHQPRIFNCEVRRLTNSQMLTREVVAPLTPRVHDFKFRRYSVDCPGKAVY